MNELVLAKIEDSEASARLLEEGRQYQLSLGFVQWTEDYPGMKDVLEDIKEGTGYVYKVDGTVASYMCIKNYEPAYEQIEKWGNEGPYIVVHRMGLSDAFRGRGLTKEIFDAIAKLGKQKGFKAIRIDTHEANKVMQSALKKSGFEFRGNVHYEIAGDRICFDRII